jgi:hypothetical protein
MISVPVECKLRMHLPSIVYIFIVEILEGDVNCILVEEIGITVNLRLLVIECSLVFSDVTLCL